MGPFLDGSRVMKAHEAGSAETARVAEKVREFYERHPYPPPIDDLDRYRRLWDDLRRRVDAHLFWPTEPYREDRSVLVAGCGTSQAAKYALRWPRAKVTGIDVSANSIRRTEKLKRKYRLENLEVRQIAVERAGELGRRFDQVVSTGVLHHLPDPDAGLRSLRDVLEPGGAMHLMVYAPYGRAGVYMLQDVLPQARYRHDDVGDPRPCSQPQSASAGSPARAPAAQCTGLPGRGCARRCAPASSGPALLSAADVRLHT